MKQKALFLTVLLACLFSGCGQATESVVTQSKPEFELSVESNIGQEDCFVCGNEGGGLIPYYAKRDSVGIIRWNDLSVCDTEVRAYDDNGNELFGQSGTNTKINSFGDGYGSVMISGMPNRGYSDAKVYYEDKDEVDFDKLKDSLCQSCLDKVVGFYVDQKNYGEEQRIGTTGYSLIDFATRELYTLSDPYRGYSIRDYYARFDMDDDLDGVDSYIDLFVFYAPERTRQ